MWKRINWEKRRYETAKELLTIYAQTYCGSSLRIAELAVKTADRLIDELKKNNHKERNEKEQI